MGLLAKMVNGSVLNTTLILITFSELKLELKYLTKIIVFKGRWSCLHFLQFYMKISAGNSKILEKRNQSYHIHFQEQALREQCLYSEFFRSVFSSIWTEYGEMRSISLYSAHMRENTVKKKTPNTDTFHAEKLIHDITNFQFFSISAVGFRFKGVGEELIPAIPSCQPTSSKKFCHIVLVNKTHLTGLSNTRISVLILSTQKENLCWFKLSSE